MRRPGLGAVVNELAAMIDRMRRADAAKNPVQALEILMGGRGSTCATEFQPDPKQEPEFAVRFTLGLPIQCPKCRPKEEEQS